MKILSFNANYFLGFDGSIRSYVQHPTRSIRANHRVEESGIDAFVSLLLKEEPDIVSLLEVDSGSFRTRTSGHTETIAERCAAEGLEYSFCVDNKYGSDHHYSRLPILRGMSNSVLWRGDCSVDHHYLSPGAKQLVHEITLSDQLSLFSVHLPLFRFYRRKQINELIQMIEERENVILSGDFNNYHGLTELQHVVSTGEFTLHRPGEALPNAILPYREIDLFVTSADLSVQRCETIDIDVSDHLPIMLEVAV